MMDLEKMADEIDSALSDIRLSHGPCDMPGGPLGRLRAVAAELRQTAPDAALTRSVTAIEGFQRALKAATSKLTLDLADARPVIRHGLKPVPDPLEPVRTWGET